MERDQLDLLKEAGIDLGGLLDEPETNHTIDAREVGVADQNNVSTHAVTKHQKAATSPGDTPARTTTGHPGDEIAEKFPSTSKRDAGVVETTLDKAALSALNEPTVKSTSEGPTRMTSATTTTTSTTIDMGAGDNKEHLVADEGDVAMLEADALAASLEAKWDQVSKFVSNVNSAVTKETVNLSKQRHDAEKNPATTYSKEDTRANVSSSTTQPKHKDSAGSPDSDKTVASPRTDDRAATHSLHDPAKFLQVPKAAETADHVTATKSVNQNQPRRAGKAAEHTATRTYVHSIHVNCLITPA